MIKVIDYYENLYKLYGDDERSLGWTKHKQAIRFSQLVRFFDIKEGESVLDIGCGFGDMRGFLENELSHVAYTGIDVVEAFLKLAQEKNCSYDDTEFICGDFLEINEAIDTKKYDYVCASGIFGYRLYDDEGMYQYINKVIEKSLKIAGEGVSLDFLSDKVDFHSGKTDFHASPSRILEIAYEHTRNGNCSGIPKKYMCNS